MIHDLTGPLAIEAYRKIGGGKVWDSEKLVMVLDHLVPADSVQSSELHKLMREFALEQGVRNFYDVGRGGICHQLMPEKGHVRPGEVIVGADSHTCTYGALGAFSTGVGSTEAASVMLTGQLWFKVPETIRIIVDGKLGKYVSPKDIILYIIGQLKCDGAVYKCVEFSGSTIRDMSVDGRMTLCNMVVEMGAKNGIIEPDEKTVEYVRARTSKPFEAIRGDSDAVYEQTLHYDVSKLEPQVACPHSVDNVKPVSEVEGIEVDQAFIGSCTNGRLEDLQVAAEILDGRKINDNVRLIIIPASQEIFLQALRKGLIEKFIKAGALVCNPNCGPCLGGHMGLLSPNEVCISSSNRNFVGRMGSPKAKVFLASPATVAASAVAGAIVDPSEYGGN
jgi:3-isopropylmalate/(R)-2-methylmalate dehydratase large subunit